MEHLPDMSPSGSGSGADLPPTPHVAYIIKPRPKWRALRIISGVFKGLAWITVGLGIIAVLFALVSGNRFDSLGIMGSLLLAVAAAIGAGILFLSLYGYAELILVLVSIEANTRKL